MELGASSWAWGVRNSLTGSSLVALPPLEQVWEPLGPSAILIPAEMCLENPPLYCGPLEEGPIHYCSPDCKITGRVFIPLLPCSGNQGLNFTVTCTKSQSYALNVLLPCIFSRHLNNCIKCFALKDWEGSVLLHPHFRLTLLGWGDQTPTLHFYLKKRNLTFSEGWGPHVGHLLRETLQAAVGKVPRGEKAVWCNTTQ